jgi:ABC-type uncharacterized transport system substrate-binding protein
VPIAITPAPGDDRQPHPLQLPPNVPLPRLRRRSPWLRNLGRGGALAAPLAALLFAAPAAGHPHLRFDWQVQPLHDDGAIRALRIHWLLDPLTTMLVMRGIDADRSGSVDQAEIDEFARQNDRLVAAGNYFVDLAREGRAVLFTVTRGLNARFDGRQMRMDFEVTLEHPVAGDLSVRLFDRTWYVALTAAQPVIPEGSAGGCEAQPRLEPAETDGWGVQQVPVVRLGCGRPPSGSS